MLSDPEREKAQEAIEGVYWRHRVWPKENPSSKPPLSKVMPPEVIRSKVRAYRAKSRAAEVLWKRRITSRQLQDEIDRMAKGSQDPQTLRELFAALDDDPVLIAETLGRQSLADRLVRTWYSGDDRFHGDRRKSAERALMACGARECLESSGGRYRETRWKREEGVRESEPDGSVRLDAGEWDLHLRRLAGLVGGSDISLRLGLWSELQQSDEAFYSVSVVGQSDREVVTATMEWPKRRFDDWWGTQQSKFEGAVEEPVGEFALPRVAATGCENDTWRALPSGAPGPRVGMTAVWTGTEMIVWGGLTFLNDGGRYNPSTDTWTPTSSDTNAPLRRADHAAVWTGTEMIVWGGYRDQQTFYGQGARYNPMTDAWAPLSTAGEPEPREDLTMVWTGSEIIVWGGHRHSMTLNTGGRYDPSTDTWAPTSTGANVPSARAYQSGVWTGAELIVWGGGGADVDPVTNTGGRYDPVSDAWQPTSVGVSVPSARGTHTAVWTGKEMIVWGGSGENTGGRYDPTTDTWQPTSTGANVPSSGRYGHTTVWTGEEMIVWGGSSTDTSGGRYDPLADTWQPTSTGSNVPSARSVQVAVWTGSEMIVWGGVGTEVFRTGGRYDPASDTWVPTSLGNEFLPEASATAVWTGAEMIVWGGNLVTGGRYDPATNSWSFISSFGAPSADGPAVWTGTEMIVWGAARGSTYTNTGGRYDPSTDTWKATSITASTPSARSIHTAVWTGTRLVVWGGYDPFEVNTGGQYDPATDAWTATSTGANVPQARAGHTAVWTGTEMLVWGGGGSLNTGGRYDPTSDAWVATPVPPIGLDGLHSHTAVWTGSEMIVWGGFNSSGRTRFGARYDPVADTWAATRLESAPSARSEHTAVWTGTEMIVWGGIQSVDPVYYNTGGRYSPSDVWTPTSTGAGVPSQRASHLAVWTDTQMVVWAGTSPMTGGAYCTCASPTTLFRDADGDGYGDAASSIEHCGPAPGGYVLDDTDCDDTQSTVHRGAVEVCDDLDNNCNGKIDERRVCIRPSPRL